MSEKEELEINENNFNDYFKDVRIHQPEKGDVIAQYTASAEFVDGNEKRQIIALLTSTEDKMEATAQVMRKLLYASELDSYKIPRQIAEDLLSGMSIEDVSSKPYKFTLEMFFYAKPENIPKDDPHWSMISVLNLGEFLDKKESQISAKILSKEESEVLNLEFKNESSESRVVEVCGDAAGVKVPEAQ